MASGTVRQIIGTVVDIEFPPDSLPELFNAVEIEMGKKQILTTEVQQHLGNNWVRCLALDATEGLSRGAVATNTCRGRVMLVGMFEVDFCRIVNVELNFFRFS